MQNNGQVSTIAKKVHLVHVMRLKGGEDFVKLLRGAHTLVRFHVCMDTHACKTCRAEDRLGLGRCIYLYAGRALPDVGGISLAFAAGSEENLEASATPFDTGGLVFGKIWIDPPADDLRTFVQRWSWKYPQWRDEFARYLASHFRHPSDYWSSGPIRSLSGIVLDSTNHRTWSFEVRCRSGHDILDAVAWCASKHMINEMKRALENVAPPEAHSERLNTFLDRFLDRQNDSHWIGDQHHHEQIECWIRGRLSV